MGNICTMFKSTQCCPYRSCSHCNTHYRYTVFMFMKRARSLLSHRPSDAPNCDSTPRQKHTLNMLYKIQLLAIYYDCPEARSWLSLQVAKASAHISCTILQKKSTHTCHTQNRQTNVPGGFYMLSVFVCVTRDTVSVFYMYNIWV